jgi:diguanylate cyclase (GGDEF)-like protein
LLLQGAIGMSDANQILIVEDHDTSREAMAMLLRDDGYDVVTAASAAGGLAAIEVAPPSLVICDLRMPGGDGISLIARVRALPGIAYVPILVVSAFGGVDDRVAALDRGADDFLCKPVDPQELLARVRMHLRRARREHELERRALVDPLTGVPNRRGIFEVLRREQERSRRTGALMSVLMVDVDHFKRLNDELGHNVGDTALRQIAAALVREVRVVDQVGRIGGDEFLIVLPATGADAAAALAARVRALRVPLVAVNVPSARIVTVSVGVATQRPHEALESLVDRADLEMYRVRRTGEIPAMERR